MIDQSKTTPLNIGQLIDELSKCDRADAVRFFDSETGDARRILFVERLLSSEGDHIVCLDRYVPDFEGEEYSSKIVTDRSAVFANIERKE